MVVGQGVDALGLEVVDEDRYGEGEVEFERRGARLSPYGAGRPAARHARRAVAALGKSRRSWLR